MQPWMSDVPAAIVRVKAELRKSVLDVEARFRTLTAQLEREVNAVVREGRNGGAVPELHYSDLAAGQVPGAVADKIRRRGCVRSEERRVGEEGGGGRRRAVWEDTSAV